MRAMFRRFWNAQKRFCPEHKLHDDRSLEVFARCSHFPCVNLENASNVSACRWWFQATPPAWDNMKDSAERGIGVRG